MSLYFWENSAIMKIPTLHGYIDRRILVNFTIDAEIVRKIIPPFFTPQVYKGKAIAGICLIRLKHIKPKGFPDFIGLSSENGAHRIAVEWEENEVQKQGVYVPRRDTSSALNTLVGGRIFPGKHYLAKFNVHEWNGHYHIDLLSSDNTRISIDVKETKDFDPNSIFENLENVSEFFKIGATGYSPKGERFEGVKLQTYSWKMRPLEVLKVHSSFYENESIFPKGSVKFDSAVLMTNIEHEWVILRDKLRKSVV